MYSVIKDSYKERDVTILKRRIFLLSEHIRIFVIKSDVSQFDDIDEHIVENRKKQQNNLQIPVWIITMKFP